MMRGRGGVGGRFGSRLMLMLRYVLEVTLVLTCLWVLLSSPPQAPHDPQLPPGVAINHIQMQGDGAPKHHVGGDEEMEDDDDNAEADKVTDGDYWSDRQQLLEGMIPPNVYYYWCGQRNFEFKHYLSVMSIIRLLRPDKIIFHYEFLPVIDHNQYNTWFEDLKKDSIFFEPRPMTAPIATAFCHGKRLDKLGVIFGKLHVNGGIFVSENTWIVDLPPTARLIDLDMSVGPNDVEGYILMRGGLMEAGVTLGEVKRNKSLTIHTGSCSAIRHVYTEVTGRCVIARGGKYDKIFPIPAIYEDDPFGRLVRRLFYGNEEIPQAKPSYEVLVPNIGHMIWLGGRPMSYVFYLSVLSMLYINKVDVLYVHTDNGLRGEYWDKITAEHRMRSRIKLVSRTPPTSVFQGYIEPYERALMSDIIRVDLMIKFGGIYTDTDAIWVKPLSAEERGYGACATYDWVDWTKPFPDVVNFGVSYGKRNAPFWRVFRDSMRVLHNDLHGFTGVAMPYKLLEKHPTLLKIDKRLGVICYYSKCHPLWVPNYHNGSNNHVTTNSIKNWKEDVHAFHWTFPDPDELANQTSLMQSTGIFAEIGKYVLKEAGLL